MNLTPWRKPSTEIVPYVLNPEIEGLKAIVINSLSHLFRRQSGGGSFGISPDGKRDYNVLFGYGQDLTFEDYYGMFRRSGIAGAVVEKVAKACWRDTPKLMVGEDEVLEEEFKQLIDLGLIKGLERADILNRVGKYSTLFIGLPDGLKADEPLGGGSVKRLDGLQFNAYTELGSIIAKRVGEASDPRFGLPETYQLQTLDFGDKRTTQDLRARTVHWERVVHLAEGALDSPIEGASALEGIWNNIIDTVKVRGGSAEAYYRNARRLLNMMAKDGHKIDQKPAAIAALRSEVENFTNSLQDVIRTEGFNVEGVDTATPTPRDAFDITVEEVSARTGIPIRVLTGKGGGQLAGSEDRASWNALVGDRQLAECTPWLLRSLQIFEASGFLQIPEGMKIVWPEQSALSEGEAAEITAKKSTALKEVMTAISTPAGDNVDTRSALDEVGLGGVELVDDLDDE